MGNWLFMASAVVMCASQTFAQTLRSEGLSLGFNANSAGFDSKREVIGATSGNTQISADADFQLHYAWGLGHQWSIGLGAVAIKKLPGSESSTDPFRLGYGVGLRATSPITTFEPNSYLFSLGAGYKF